MDGSEARIVCTGSLYVELSFVECLTRLRNGACRCAGGRILVLQNSFARRRTGASKFGRPTLQETALLSVHLQARAWILEDGLGCGQWSCCRVPSGLFHRKNKLATRDIRRVEHACGDVFRKPPSRIRPPSRKRSRCQACIPVQEHVAWVEVPRDTSMEHAFIHSFIQPQTAASSQRPP